MTEPSNVNRGNQRDTAVASIARVSSRHRAISAPNARAQRLFENRRSRNIEGIRAPHEKRNVTIKRQAPMPVFVAVNRHRFTLPEPNYDACN